MKMNTQELLAHLRELTSPTAKMSADSRQIQKGDIFLAYPIGHGSALRDGRIYIESALQNGAAAIVFDPAEFSNPLPEHPLCFAYENLATDAGSICADWYGFPSKKLSVIGVTGTNGKTSVSQWLAQALEETHHQTAVIGTLGAGFIGALKHNGYTTPDAPSLQAYLKEFLDAGAKSVVMEASSHALDQSRVRGISMNCAVFLNLTQDHLDYHGSMAEYANAKAKLFQIEGLEHAVLNLDDPFGRELAMQLLPKSQIQVWGYALSKDTFAGFEKFGNRLHRIYAEEISSSTAGYDAKFYYEGVGSNPIQLAVLGQFNLSNCLAVWAVLLTQGLSHDQATVRLSKLRQVPGRMELIQLHKNQRTEGPMVVVDYAHTPDALEKVLLALRPLASQRDGKVWCVFGCGGDRDTSKRADMGRISQALSDHVILTSDNPRSEDAEVIIEMIKAGMHQDTQHVQTIADRAAAIMAAVRHADVRDIVLVAGKGHESTQEIKGKKFDFSDQEHIQLAARGGI
ncbi:UDP-N-acetylmuramoylalanyl-D-glutamate--2,6-diaminopimelate ligase [Polynucleobacter meluiroseus]|uniref:UDP-N-acetylmuramoyl-L-alanyl-D-glutamate--2,6-diaminopimelate ligase n=1 Tax=Polynucleobacter meluiroseus TaxID=1938814 RepID=A0A240E267_9BURK|nr:UDP-N-acetylmuramoyl-L-alanyl-D-glutamate--2,6-diaminopimelate ligase [Polynucleobacter meluiroseus]SNX28960.1 UDP-N-acetylmuramoylalanyl-D-glutamate--2,6-diaminopimelate ligase [Polynucleobacter meluiroseus]